MKKCNCKKQNKKIHKCLECDNIQDPGSYCQTCCGTNMVTIGPGVPPAGCKIKSCEMVLLSLGEIDKRGRLRVATTDAPGEYWGAVHDYEVMG